MDNPLLTFLKLFTEIPPDDQAFIESLVERRVYKEGDILFKGGKICTELFFIGSGILRIVVINEKGNEVTHYFLKDNQFCTIFNSFRNQVPAEESIQAACDAEVVAIPRPKLLLLYEKLPYLKKQIDQIIERGLLEKIQTRNAYLGQDSTTRYHLFLKRQPEIAQRVSLSDVASYLGITPQSLSRIRKNSR